MPKRKILLLVLVALFLTTPWLLAGDDPAREADAPGPEATTSQSLPAGVEWVAANATGDCSVSLECSDGTIIQCDGSNSSCTTGPNYVECDGQRTYCPTQSCSVRVYCRDANCDITCSSSTGDCKKGSNYVSCDGETTYCPDGSFLICPS